MPLNYTSIIQPIQNDINIFKSRYFEALKTDAPFLDKIIKYMSKQKGKLLRPSLIFYSARLFGNINDLCYASAMMVEMVHHATLLHDDVIDNAKIRRNYLSINTLWKNKISILVGDYMFSKVLNIGASHTSLKHIEVISDTVKKMTHGELRQLRNEYLLKIDKELYLRIIGEKTASLMAACCQYGAMAHPNNEKIYKDMWNIGYYIGIAFQIQDDIIDFQANSGKAQYGDIYNKKITLPIIFTYEKASKMERWTIHKIMRKRKKTKKDITQLINLIRDKEGIEQSQKIMYDFAKKAFDLLNNIHAKQNIDEWKQFAQYFLERKI